MTQLIRNIRAVFECIRQAGLKLSIDKCHFGVTEVEFLGRTITPQGIAPKTTKSRTLANVRFPKSKKQEQRYISFVNYYIPRLSEKLLGFYELLKADKQIKVTEEMLDNYKTINAALAEACGLALKQTITMPKRPDDGCQLPHLRLCANDRKRKFQKENFRSCSIWIKSILTSTTEDVNLLQRISGNLSRIPRIQPHLVGNNTTNPCND